MEGVLVQLAKHGFAMYRKRLHKASRSITMAQAYSPSLWSRVSLVTVTLKIYQTLAAASTSGSLEPQIHACGQRVLTTTISARDHHDISPRRRIASSGVTVRLAAPDRAAFATQLSCRKASFPHSPSADSVEVHSGSCNDALALQHFRGATRGCSRAIFTRQGLD